MIRSPVGLVFEVAGLGHVEVDPHHAGVGEGREGVPLLDQTPLLLLEAADEAVEWRLDDGEAQFGLGKLRLGLGLRQLGLGQCHFLLGDHRLLACGNFLVLLELDLSDPDLGQLGVQLGLGEDRQHLEQHVALLHRLALLDRDLLEIPARQGARR